MILRAVPCCKCGREPELRTVQMAQGYRLFYVCPTCPPPVEGHHLWASAFEATTDWNERNEWSETGNDSPLMKAALRDARFLVTLHQGTPETDNYDEIRESIQKMIDDHTAEIFLGMPYLLGLVASEREDFDLAKEWKPGQWKDFV